MVYSSSAQYAAAQKRASQVRHAVGAAPAIEADHKYHGNQYLVKQLSWLALSLIVLFAMYCIDYHRLKDSGPYLLLLSFVLLILVFIPGIGKTINDHRRWIGIAGFTFQPSELAKLALIIYMSRMLTNHHDKLKSFIHGVIPALLLMGVFAGLIVLEPDIGAGIVTVMIIFLMWFIGGMRVLHLTGLVAAVIPVFVAAVRVFPDRVERVLAFVSMLFDSNPQATLGKGYQLFQSLIAVGSGGVTGVGLGHSMQKYFLTEQFSDFIFAIICEETGFIGSSLIIILFLLLIWEGWRIALRGPDFYATLLASGITLMLTISVALNLMVVTGLAPTKGLALPFLSYGGSSLIITMGAIGVLMNIGKYVEEQAESTPAVARMNPLDKPKASSKRKTSAKGWFRKVFDY